MLNCFLKQMKKMSSTVFWYITNRVTYNLLFNKLNVFYVKETKTIDTSIKITAKH